MLQLEKGPLFRLKVLELASVLAGPSVGQFLAELGADVIKVENIKTGGDVTRSWLGKEEKLSKEGISAYFSSVNWGKKSLALDLSSHEGQAILHKLIPQTDIVITSFKPGDDHKLQVDFTTLKTLNPSIIYGHITGYGPNNEKTGYDAVIQAETGFMYINGEPGGAHLKMPVALVDILAAHHLKEGILLSLLKRNSSGMGDYVHVSLFDAALSSLANQASNWLVAKSIPAKMGQEHPNIAPYGKSFVTEDNKNVLLAVGTDRQFQMLCNVLDIGQASLDLRFKTNSNRVKHREKLNALLSNRIKKYPAKKLIDQLNLLSVPCGLINAMDEVFELKESADMMLLDSNIESAMRGIRNTAFSFGLNRFNIAMSSPPSFGQHSSEILSQILDYPDELIKNLEDKGVIA